MNIKCKIKKGDNVIVVAGKDKKKIGEVLFVYPKTQKVLVQGVNLNKKHVKPSRDSEGGILDKYLPVDISNVAFLDPKMSKPTKIGYKIENGEKVRFAKLSGSVLN